MHKKLGALLLVLAMMFTLAACGGEATTPPEGEQPAAGETVEPPAEGDDGQEVALSQSKIAKIFEDADKLYIIMQTEQDMGSGAGPEVLDMLLAVDGDKYCIDNKTPSSRYTMIGKDGMNYVLTHSEKTYMATPGGEESGMSIAKAMFFLNDETLANVAESTEELNGETYDVESVDSEGLVTKYYFDGDKLVYFVVMDQVTEVLEYGDEIDESWFDIPEDYQLTDMSELFGDVDAQDLEDIEGLEGAEELDGAEGN